LAPRTYALFLLFILALLGIGFAQQATFHNAPASAAAMPNPYAGKPAALTVGKKLYAQNCAQCHGNNLHGMGPAPSLVSAKVRDAKPGEVFWFITTGKLESGMPSWSSLPKNQRWQIVSFVQSQAEKAQAK
jgi:mono/diheme cytochrome c family protein